MLQLLLFFKLLVTTFVVIVTIITASILILRAQNFRWDSIIFLECRLIDKTIQIKDDTAADFSLSKFL